MQMLSLRTIELFIGIVTTGIAYIISATTAGYVQAWTAKKMGDDSPEIAGFETWNPLVHIDFFGAACLFLLGIGWGKALPINPMAIKGKLKLGIVFLSRSFVYVFIAFVSLLVLLRLLGLTVLNLAMTMVLSEYVSLSALAKVYPEHSSFILALALIGVMLIYIGVLFSVLDFIIGIFRFAQVTYLQHLAFSPEGNIIQFLIAFLAIFIFAKPLKLIVVYGISYVAYFLAPLLGVS
jgi:hypothetical protein